MAETATSSSPTTEQARERRALLLVLGICPMMAASDTLTRALGLGLVSLLTLTAASLVMAGLGRGMRPGLRFATTVVVVAGTIGCLTLLMNAFAYRLHDSLGIFLPLLAGNVLIVCTAQETATAGAARAALRGAATGGLVVMVLLLLAAARELVGRGSLWHDAGALLGSRAGALETTFFREDLGFLLAMLPPGAFISLGLLAAAWNWLRNRARPVER